MIPAEATALDRLEAALVEGRLTDVRTEAEALERELTPEALRRLFNDDPDLARSFAARAERLRSVGRYVSAVVRTLASISPAPDEVYGRPHPGKAERRRPRIRLEA